MALRTPILDSRDAQAAVAELLSRLPAYVPELDGAAGGRARALIEILGSFAQAVIMRLNQAPDKNKLAFLDWMGINLLPAQAARAPVVFRPLPIPPLPPGPVSPIPPPVGDGHVPAQTRVGTGAPGSADAIIFETERAIALASANLTAVLTVFPDRDAYVDHTGAAAAGLPFRLFRPLAPIAHELYLAHDTLLALAGSSKVAIEFELSAPGSKPLSIAWQFWNGQVWQEFVTSDPTSGLTRTGVVRLANDCGAAQRATVNGIEAYWLRGVLTAPLPPETGRVFPAVNRIRLSTTISRPLPSGCSGGIRPDAAVGDGAKVDLTKSFYPLGRNPQEDSTFYFSSEEVFAKPGAKVKLCFDRTPTAEEAADKLAAQTLANQALALELKAASLAGKIAVDAATALIPFAVALGQLNAAILAPLNAEIGLLQAAATVQQPSDVTALASEISTANSIMGQVPVAPAIPAPFGFAAPSFDKLVRDVVPVLETLRDIVPLLAATHTTIVHAAASRALGLLNFFGQRELLGLLLEANYNFGEWIGVQQVLLLLDATIANFVPATPIDSLLDPAGKSADAIVALADLSLNVSLSCAPWYQAALEAGNVAADLIGYMAQLINSPGNGTVDGSAPKLDPPRLVWEYWNGSAWRNLLGPVDDDPTNFLGHGTVSFVVPGDLEPSEVSSQTARWVRVRLVSGSYSQLRYVSWNDQVTHSISSMAILQPHPPVLSGFYMGYEYHSPKTAAEHCIAWNDFKYDDFTAAAEWAGSPFEPYQPTADRTPALYLGFDRPLPEDVIGLYFDVRERQDVTDGPPLAWEYWDGAAWTSLAVEDDTHNLVLPGMVSTIWPGPTARQLARFGTPLTWIRARLESEGDPASSVVDGVYLNAVWAANRQTVQGEVLGSGDGQPNQVFFFRQTPVLESDAFEVRELDGPRAAVEYPILRDDLLSRGGTDADVRLVTDPRSGKITEVWVRWSVRPNLLFAGPDSREATIERTRGRLILGDGLHGRTPPPGQANVRAALYRFGGGDAGNVPAGSIRQLLSGVTAQSVANPRRAEGGAANESLDRVLVRGPRVLRHRYRAVSAEDYEDLAREASPGVAITRALPATHPNGRPAPGWVTLLVVPRSADAQPQPSYELRRLVSDYVLQRAPATVAGLGVIGPTYLPVGVQAVIHPVSPDLAKAAAESVTAALAAFLHPLTGGPEGEGWPFGRGVYLSDVAAVVEAIPAVDYASRLELQLNGTPSGEHVGVPSNRIVVAGPIIVALEG